MNKSKVAFRVALIAVLVHAVFGIIQKFRELSATHLEPDVEGYRLLALQLNFQENPYATESREPLLIWRRFTAGRSH